MSKVDEELIDRDRLAEKLVEHLIRAGSPAKTELPLSHVDSAGALTLWKVTVERVGRLDF